MLADSVEDNNHLFICGKRKTHLSRRSIINQIKILRKTVDENLCDILQEGIMAYFLGECMTNTMLTIRGQKDMGRYNLLIDEQLLIGWDNLLRGKFTKQWKIQQPAYKTRVCLKDPRRHARKQRKKKRDEDKNKNKQKNKTVAFHLFFQAIVPFVKEVWKGRGIGRNTPVGGGRIVAEYDSLIKKVTHLYIILREIVLPEDEL